ncbi:MAG TPA: type II toxin-antitoxin system VapC family toxin [Longimicrobiales bacterium]|nr:type II toxin-antitoxin system VapC family toxin [Longimicrobiales bacterium]
MRYLLDTNVLSEAARREPNGGVVEWLEGRASLDLALSVLTLGEIRKGVALLAAGKRKRRLEDWLAVDLVRQFSGRVLPVDEAVALAWGGLAADGRASGRELPVIDGLLLATAAVHRLTLVTRHERDCAGRGVPVLNPWV